MFEKILIANRGEIACRIMGTAQKKGIKTVAVYSSADAAARHVRLADEAYEIGGPEASDSYLSMDRIVEVARTSGAEAIHPGYGFLSENEEFARKCEEVDIRFIGPAAESIHIMGLKDEAKIAMKQAGIPTIPGYDGENQSAQYLEQQAGEIGFPVLIKAVAGGGGKGMRLVETRDKFSPALESAKREALSSFGNDRVLLEKYIRNSRHIEVQIFADMVGNVVYLHERDCSLQRRHQKVVEEAPAPDLSEDMRYELGETAIQAAKAIKYKGAGTIEFIVDVENGLKDAPFYFMEMNTRLQVEHPVTELITGIDLVEWQLRIAAGERLPLGQRDIKLNGHAFEVRLYAEDPYKDFLPQTGTLHHFSVPIQDNWLRLDSGIDQGDEVSVFYDPMIAKLIVWGHNRGEALRHMRRVLKSTTIAGIKTNLEFLYNIFDHDAFSVADFDTGFIEKYSSTLIPSKEGVSPTVLALAALCELMPHKSGSDVWDWSDGWLLNLNLNVKLTFIENDTPYDVDVTYMDDGFSVSIGGRNYKLKLLKQDAHKLSILLDGKKITGSVIRNKEDFTVFYEGQVSYLHHFIPGSDKEEMESQDGNILTPMPGKLAKIFVKDDEEIEEGQALFVLEAMKMEHTIKASVSGQIILHALQEGMQIGEGQSLARVMRRSADD